MQEKRNKCANNKETLKNLPIHLNRIVLILELLRNSSTVKTEYINNEQVMRIQTKLFAIFLISSVFLTVALFAIIQWSIGKGMIDYVNAKEIEELSPVAETLAEHFELNGSWTAFNNDPRLFFDLIRDITPFNSEARKRQRAPRGDHPPQRRPRDGRRPPPKGQQGRRPPPGFPPPPLGYALLDEQQNIIVGRISSDDTYNTVNINLDGETIGFIKSPRRDKLTQGYELNFIEQQNTSLLIFSVLLLGITLIIALPLARHIIRPIKQLTQGMHDLTQGQFDRQLALKRKDEFNQLEQDFNELAHTLKKNENARRNWLADVSHELRTPVAVLKGEIEAVIDGIRPLSLEQFLSAQEEIFQLERLIEDLHELTRSDIGTLHYQKQPIDMRNFVLNESKKFTHLLTEHHIELETVTPHEAVIFNADEKRLKQLLSNLITNVIRYAENAQQVRISLTKIKNCLNLTLEDDGPGVRPEHLDKLFDYLYRTESSRNRNTGGSGLGLAICKKIAIAHNGKIWASQSSLGGLAVSVEFSLDLQG